jgi:hypothetical protein
VNQQPRFVFLVSDSRSGSTLLARELTARVAKLVVTTELNFDPVFARLRIRLQAPQRIAQRVAAQPNFSGDPVNDDGQVWAHELTRGGDAAGKLFFGLMERWLSGNWRGVPPDCVVIKNGSHARYASVIYAALTDRVKFIFLVRDPRSVVASKLRTRRPYAPWEVMAWGGSLIAALRWRGYARKMNRVKERGAQVLEVRYEDLIQNPAVVIDAIAEFCGCTTLATETHASYRVPPAEAQIHTMATSEAISASRLTEWTTALAARDKRIVEAVCATEMRARSYPLTTKGRYTKRILICAAAAPESAWRVLTHVKNGLVARVRTQAHGSVNGRSEN